MAEYKTRMETFEQKHPGLPTADPGLPGLAIYRQIGDFRNPLAMRKCHLANGDKTGNVGEFRILSYFMQDRTIGPILTLYHS